MLPAEGCGTGGSQGLSASRTAPQPPASELLLARKCYGPSQPCTLHPAPTPPQLTPTLEIGASTDDKVSRDRLVSGNFQPRVRPQKPSTRPPGPVLGALGSLRG